MNDRYFFKVHVSKNDYDIEVYFANADYSIQHHEIFNNVKALKKWVNLPEIAPLFLNSSRQLIRFLETEYFVKNLNNLSNEKSGDKYSLFFDQTSPIFSPCIYIQKAHYEVKFDLSVMIYHSCQKNLINALSYYEKSVENVINEDIDQVLLYAEDYMVYETYFLVYSKFSDFFGFCDDPSIDKAQYIASIKTENFLNFLQFFKSLYPTWR